MNKLAVAARLQEIAREIRVNPGFDIEEALEVLLEAMKPEPSPEMVALRARLYDYLLGDRDGA